MNVFLECHWVNIHQLSQEGERKEIASFTNHFQIHLCILSLIILYHYIEFRPLHQGCV